MRKVKGFTLIELVVVISIIFLLNVRKIAMKCQNVRKSASSFAFSLDLLIGVND